VDNVYIQKVLDGHTDAFKYFVTTYKDFAFSLSYSLLKNDYRAEEAVQESFIKAFDKLNTFKHHAQFKTWFGRIVINESLKKTEKESHSGPFEEIAESETEESTYALNGLLAKERKYYITKVFEQLSPEESLVLELFYLKEFAIEEICEMTGWSASKVKMLNLRGRKNFYRHLSSILKSEMNKIL